MKPAAKRVRRGVSMVEIMIALFILGLILGPLVASFLQSSGIVKIGAQDLEALNLGNGFAAQVRKLQATLLPETGGEQPLPPPAADGLVRLGGPGDGNPVLMPPWDGKTFTLTYRIARFTPAPTGDGLPREGKLVVLSIRWRWKIGQERTARFPVLLLDG